MKITHIPSPDSFDDPITKGQIDKMNEPDSSWPQLKDYGVGNPNMPQVDPVITDTNISTSTTSSFSSLSTNPLLDMPVYVRECVNKELPAAVKVLSEIEFEKSHKTGAYGQYTEIWDYAWELEKLLSAHPKDELACKNALDSIIAHSLLAKYYLSQKA